jgi:hypothetical protein
MALLMDVKALHQCPVIDDRSASPRTNGVLGGEIA